MGLSRGGIGSPEKSDSWEPIGIGSLSGKTDLFGHWFPLLPNLILFPWILVLVITVASMAGAGWAQLWLCHWMRGKTLTCMNTLHPDQGLSPFDLSSVAFLVHV